MADPTERVLLDRVPTQSGRQVNIELRFAGEVVQVTRERRCVATFDKCALIDWFLKPDGQHAKDDVTFTLDRLVDRDGSVAMTMPDITAWTLGDDVVARIRHLLCR
jgi:hypothetical protein